MTTKPKLLSEEELAKIKQNSELIHGNVYNDRRALLQHIEAMREEQYRVKIRLVKDASTSLMALIINNTRITKRKHTGSWVTVKEFDCVIDMPLLQQAALKEKGEEE